MIMSIVRAVPLLLCASLAVAAGPSEFPTPLTADSTLKVETLPSKYPTGWAFLNYAGELIELRNVGSDTREVKGQLQARDSSILLVSDKRPEIYVADTVWSRGVRGTRTDFITIYDKQTTTSSNNDCCGGVLWGRCPCQNNQGDRPIARPQTNNEVTWCFGTKSQSYTCTVAIILGVALDQK